MPERKTKRDEAKWNKRTAKEKIQKIISRKVSFVSLGSTAFTIPNGAKMKNNPKMYVYIFLLETT